MANKRDLKKRIQTVCGDIASDALIASVLFSDKVDSERINIIINEIAALQEDSIALASFSFDRSRRDFNSEKEYRHARRSYFATAYKKLNKEFIERAIEIVKQLNDVVPEEARKVVSQF